MRVTLKRVDQSGVYALPDSLTADQVQILLLNGNVVPDDRYVVVKDSTEIDVFDADPAAVVTAILK